MTASQDPTDRDVGGLSLRGIAKKYGPITVLNDVNLDVRPGEAIALLGENGAGKSTLASIISGLVQPTIGSMTWRRQDYAPLRIARALHTVESRNQTLYAHRHLEILRDPRRLQRMRRVSFFGAPSKAAHIKPRRRKGLPRQTED